MQNHDIVAQWLQFAEDDLRTAKYLLDLYPRPLEIICYHCQQAVEKGLKGLLIAFGVQLIKTHDLGLLAERLAEFTDIDESLLDACDSLTPYGVRVRYPQEIAVDERHAIIALENAEKFFTWLQSIKDEL